MIEKSNNLLTIPPDAGQAIIEAGAVIARPLLGTDKFIQFCKNRGLSIDRERLIRLERMHLFAPIFRVKTPETDVAPFAIPPSTNNNWLEKGWAWDTTSVNPSYTVPDPKDRTQGPNPRRLLLRLPNRPSSYRAHQHDTLCSDGQLSGIICFWGDRLGA